MERRDFLKMAGITPLVLMAPTGALGANTSGKLGQRILVLIELKGGNDGLNTLIPFTDPAYYKLRPQLAIAKDQVVQLSQQIGFHPNMNAMMDAWNAKDLAIVQGVGYKNPNRSHFRSIAIWETASKSNQNIDKGWLSEQLQGHVPKNIIADAIAVGQQEIGPLRGPLRTLVIRNPNQMIRVTKALIRPSKKQSSNPALQHLLKTQNDLVQITSGIKQNINKVPKLKHRFPKGRFGKELAMATKIIAGGLPVMVLKVTLGSFDTHAGQINRHKNLLGQLGGGLAALRKNLIELNKWNDTLVMTYSEFGRRAAQNGSRGTDHGTSAPQFFMGGKVKGGFYGKQPSLTDLANQDLKHHVDFKSMYATITNGWWDLPIQGQLKGYKPLKLLKP